MFHEIFFHFFAKHPRTVSARGCPITNHYETNNVLESILQPGHDADAAVQFPIPKDARPGSHAERPAGRRPGDLDLPRDVGGLLVHLYPIEVRMDAGHLRPIGRIFVLLDFRVHRYCSCVHVAGTVLYDDWHIYNPPRIAVHEDGDGLVYVNRLVHILRVRLDGRKRIIEALAIAPISADCGGKKDRGNNQRDHAYPLENLTHLLRLSLHARS